VRKVYIVDLSAEERAQLLELTRKGTTQARRVRRAQVLLAAADGATDAAIVRMLHVARATVERTRQRFVGGGLSAALEERPRPGAKAKLDGKAEAYLVALACSAPPEGRSRWTMQLLADRLVELNQIDAISGETVRRTLKKTTSSRG